uniref:SCP domain-containing protein n=1 Tax=Strongyloides venezuelensis TaxID=75913 RepID=A0A0K0FIW8_STRVS
MSDMVNFMLKEKFPEGIENICIYNLGYKQGRRVIKNYNETCESVLRYVYPHYSHIEYNVMYPRSYRQNVYTCGIDVTYKLQSILDYALKKNCFIRLIQRGIKPTPPPLNICVSTLNGRKCQLTNPNMSGYWRKIWSDCNIDCFFSMNYGIARIKYLTEINYYRKTLKKEPLHLNQKLSVLATKRAESIAVGKWFTPDLRKDHHDMIGFASNGYAVYLLKILFDNAYNMKHILKLQSQKNKDFMLLMSSSFRYVGFGFSKKSNNVYVCIKVSKNAV